VILAPDSDEPRAAVFAVTSTGKSRFLEDESQLLHSPLAVAYAYDRSEIIWNEPSDAALKKGDTERISVFVLIASRSTTGTSEPEFTISEMSLDELFRFNER